jgi:hypothetical protein
LSQYYFTSNTDEAICKFINSTDKKEKHELFNTEIRPAFEKLIENIIFVYGFFKLDDVETLKSECLSNLYEMLPKFDPSKSNKGFSYFNVICKNWFIQKTKEKNKKNKVENELHVDIDHESISNDPNFTIAHYEEQVEEKEKWIMFYEAMNLWRGRLSKKSEIQVLEAIIFIMKNPDLVPIFNKKAVYLYLRELTDLNTKQIVVILKKIKILYEEWKEAYEESGGFDFGEENRRYSRRDSKECP